MYSHEGILFAYGINGLFNGITGEKISDNKNIVTMATVNNRSLKIKKEGYDPEKIIINWAESLSSTLEKLVAHPEKDN